MPDTVRTSSYWKSPNGRLGKHMLSAVYYASDIIAGRYFLGLDFLWKCLRLYVADIYVFQGSIFVIPTWCKSRDISRAACGNKTLVEVPRFDKLEVLSLAEIVSPSVRWDDLCGVLATELGLSTLPPAPVGSGRWERRGFGPEVAAGANLCYASSRANNVDKVLIRHFTKSSSQGCSNVLWNITKLCDRELIDDNVTRHILLFTRI